MAKRQSDDVLSQQVQGLRVRPADHPALIERDGGNRRPLEELRELVERVLQVPPTLEQLLVLGAQLLFDGVSLDQLRVQPLQRLRHSRGA